MHKDDAPNPRIDGEAAAIAVRGRILTFSMRLQLAFVAVLPAQVASLGRLAAELEFISSTTREHINVRNVISKHHKLRDLQLWRG